MAADNEEWWKPIVEFLVHSFCGTAVFVIIYVPGIGLHLGVHWLVEKLWNSLAPLIVVMALMEYALLTVDTFLYVMFLFTTTRKAYRKLQL